MEWLAAFRLRLKTLVRRPDRDLEDELSFHLAMREAKDRASDVTAHDAQAAAKKQFGNVARIKEACREMRTFMSLETFLQDLRYGARGLVRSPGLTLVTALTLALGIGASSWQFAMLRQWVVEAVSFPQPERLVVLWELDKKKGWWGPASAPDYLDWKKDNRVLESLSAWTPAEFNVGGRSQDGPQRTLGARVSASFLRTLRVQPVIGRDFTESEDQPAAQHVAIVSNGLWRERLQANPDLSNATLNLDGEAYAVIGVMPEDFHFTLMGRANIWVPLVLSPAERTDRSKGWLQVIGRLSPGVSLAVADESLKAMAQRIENAHPETNTNSSILTMTLAKEIGRHVGNQAVYVGFLVAICILLIACSNVAGVYLARTLARRKEMTMRLALGARKLRLTRQLLSENALLIPVAVGLGLVLATVGGRALTSAIPYENRGYLPNYGRIVVDASTLVYGVAVAALSVMLFSLAPVLEAYRLDLTGVLKEVGSSAGVRGQGLRKTLVVAEIVLALTTLVPAALVAKSLSNLLREDPGFRSDHVLTVRLSLPAVRYKDKVQWLNFYQRLIERIRALPQVEAVGASQYIPFGHSNAALEFWIENQPSPERGNVPSTDIACATPGYFSTLGLSLIRGRFIADEDGPDSQPVVVINQTMERRYFARGSALGRRIRLGRNDLTWYTVVGVFKDVKLYDLGDRPQNESYTSFAQVTARDMSLVLRSNAAPELLSSALRNAVTSQDSELPVTNAVGMGQLIDDEEAPFRIFAQFALGFAALAMFLAGMGIYGIMAYLVESRAREIGIRMACGAERRNILWLVMTGSLKLVGTGVVIGLAGAWAVTRLLSGLLHGVSASDPSTYGISIAVMIVAILAASFVPVRRATRVDPMTVLRCD